jgi:hypothetical protein
MDGEEIGEYLEGFNFHLGEREMQAVAGFRKLVASLDGQHEVRPDIHQS